MKLLHQSYRETRITIQYTIDAFTLLLCIFRAPKKQKQKNKGRRFPAAAGLVQVLEVQADVGWLGRVRLELGSHAMASEARF